MLTHIMPASAFAAATTAPATMPSAPDVFDFLGQHCLAVALVASVAVLVLVVRGFAKDAQQHRSIRSAYRQWDASGQPIEGWGPGWAWSPRPGEPVEDDVQEDEQEPAAAEVEVCQACHSLPATVTIAYTGGPTFAVCSACSPVATVVGRAS